MTPFQLRRTVGVLRAGGLIAYPTEAVFGLGCDPFAPHAVQALLDLKARPMEKGLILIAADLAQLTDLLEPLDTRTRLKVQRTWPGPVTWLLPAKPEVPGWLRGKHPELAVRVTGHPLAAALCRAFGGPLVSTSANRAGRPPARTALQVRRTFGDAVDYVVSGEVGGQDRPSEIRDASTDRIIRAG